jgi:hypothetical protein
MVVASMPARAGACSWIGLALALWSSPILAPAAAFAELQAVSSSAFGEQVDVLDGAITSGPLPNVALGDHGAGPVADTVAGACVPSIRCGVLRAGVLHVSTEGSPSGNLQGSASVANPEVAGGSLTADLVQSRCSGGDTGLGGAAALTGVRVGRELVAASPAPNTVVRVPGVATVTLNEQIRSANSITVNAVHARLLGRNAGDVVLSQAHCDLTVSAPPASPESPLGVLLPLSTMAVLMGAVVWAWRRDRRRAGGGDQPSPGGSEVQALATAGSGRTRSKTSSSSTGFTSTSTTSPSLKAPWRSLSAS